jgi:hypothetical protein
VAERRAAAAARGVFRVFGRLPPARILAALSSPWRPGVPAPRHRKAGPVWAAEPVLCLAFDPASVPHDWRRNASIWGRWRRQALLWLRLLPPGLSELVLGFMPEGFLRLVPSRPTAAKYADGILGPADTGYAWRKSALLAANPPAIAGPASAGHAWPIRRATPEWLPHRKGVARRVRGVYVGLREY